MKINKIQLDRLKQKCECVFETTTSGKRFRVKACDTHSCFNPNKETRIFIGNKKTGYHELTESYNLQFNEKEPTA